MKVRLLNPNVRVRARFISPYRRDHATGRRSRNRQKRHPENAMAEAPRAAPSSPAHRARPHTPFASSAPGENLISSPADHHRHRTPPMKESRRGGTHRARVRISQTSISFAQERTLKPPGSAHEKTVGTSRQPGNGNASNKNARLSLTRKLYLRRKRESRSCTDLDRSAAAGRSANHHNRL